MNFTLWIGIILPFVGTTLGSLTVYFGRHSVSVRLRIALYGIACGVMCAASIFSLILPALAGKETFLPEPLPVLIGFALGVGFIRLIGKYFPEETFRKKKGFLSFFSASDLSIVIHNIPEGMAVGVVFAGALAGENASFAEPLALSVGIAIQNFPEGAVLSLPLFAKGNSKHKSFILGALSGIVEPIAAVLTLFAARKISVILPYCLGFAAGAMIDAVTRELLPDIAKEDASFGSLFFSFGFCLMMALDVIFG